jgi:hypothetical protein
VRRANGSGRRSERSCVPPAVLEETETGMIGRDNTRAAEWFPVLACAQSQTIIAFSGAWQTASMRGQTAGQVTAQL